MREKPGRSIFTRALATASAPLGRESSSFVPSMADARRFVQSPATTPVGSSRFSGHCRYCCLPRSSPHFPRTRPQREQNALIRPSSSGTSRSVPEWFSRLPRESFLYHVITLHLLAFSGYSVWYCNSPLNLAVPALDSIFQGILCKLTYLQAVQFVKKQHGKIWYEQFMHHAFHLMLCYYSIPR